MPQSGRELKARLAQLMRRHNVRPIARDPIPLLPPTAGSQIIEAIAASATDVDADRMSFARGSLSWPDDLSKLPLLVRHSATGNIDEYHAGRARVGRNRFGKAENTLRCLDAGKLDHLFANTETKSRMRADIEQEQLRLVEIQWRRVRPQIRGRGGPGAATADARRLWYGTRGPTGFPVDGCYRAAAGVGSERFALPACADEVGL